MQDEQRRQLMIELMQSYKRTGQLFFKLLHSATHKEPIRNMAGLPILKALKQQESMSQSEIARELHHSDAAISRQIKILTDDGLVSIRSNEQNRRVSVVELTEKGEKALQKFEAIVINHMTETLAEVPDDQIQQFIDNNNQLQKIIISKTGREQ